MQDFCFASKVFAGDFSHDKHVNYLLKSLKKSNATGMAKDSAEAHQLSLVFFIVSGLDLLDALDSQLSRSDRESIIDWIYSYQIQVNKIRLVKDFVDSSDDIEKNSQQPEQATNVSHQEQSARNHLPCNQHLHHNHNRHYHNHPQHHHYHRNHQHHDQQQIHSNNNYSNSTTTTNINNNTNQPTLTNQLTSQQEKQQQLQSQYPQQPQAHHSNNYHRHHNNQAPYHHRKNQRLNKPPRAGFAGFRATGMLNSDIPFDCGTISMTYCALSALIILGDDLKRVDRRAIIEGMRYLQLPDGSFEASITGGETDMRLVYCAAAVSRLLDDWSGMNRDKAAQFIKKCLSYEGAFGQCPNAEAHGGSTYCAIASLKLMSKLEDTLNREEIDRLIRWCLNRLDCGFSGRPNKDQDTCYSFWIGACLVMLDHFKFVEQENLLDFVLLAQEERGGLSKVPLFYSDPLHTYLGFAGSSFVDRDLSSARQMKLLKLDPMLNISLRAKAHMDKIHEDWRRTSGDGASGGGSGDVASATAIVQDTSSELDLVKK